MKKNSKKRHLKAVLLVMLAAVAVSAVVLLSVSLLLSNAETCLAANIGTGNSIQEEESE